MGRYKVPEDLPGLGPSRNGMESKIVHGVKARRPVKGCQETLSLESQTTQNGDPSLSGKGLGGAREVR
jgi:hypothetical protein